MRSPGVGTVLSPAAEEEIAGWINELRRDGVPVSTTMLQLKAREVAAVSLSHPTRGRRLFCATIAWHPATKTVQDRNRLTMTSSWVAPSSPWSTSGCRSLASRRFTTQTRHSCSLKCHRIRRSKRVVSRPCGWSVAGEKHRCRHLLFSPTRTATSFVPSSYSRPSHRRMLRLKLSTFRLVTVFVACHGERSRSSRTQTTYKSMATQLRGVTGSKPITRPNLEFGF